MRHDVLSVAAYSKISDKFLEGVGANALPVTQTKVPKHRQDYKTLTPTRQNHPLTLSFLKQNNNICPLKLYSLLMLHFKVVHT